MTVHTGEWTADDIPAQDRARLLPPRLSLHPSLKRCGVGRGAYICTRPFGHGGRHAAAGFKLIYAVWAS